jgi:hypothetical protein
MEHGLFPTHHHRVTGIVAALKTDDDLGVLR